MSEQHPNKPEETPDGGAPGAGDAGRESDGGAGAAPGGLEVPGSETTAAAGNGDQPLGTAVTAGAALDVEAPRGVLPAGAGHPAEPPEDERNVRTLLRAAFVRFYSLALAVGVAAVCGSAIIYLYKFVFTPPQLPAALSQWQGSLDAAALRQPHVAGVTDDAARAPMNHYHKVDKWFQPDLKNTCTAAGCHSPLPHDKGSKIAAFSNLHVTFMDCMVCHDPSNAGAPKGRLQAGWVTLADYQPRDVPAVLQLIKFMEGLGNNPAKADAEQAHPTIVGLLRQVIGAVGQDGLLDDLLVQIEASVPASPLWRRSVQRLTAELPAHARGEYAAKVARSTVSPLRPELAGPTKAFLAAAEGSEARKRISDGLHQGVLAKPSACANCHTTEKAGMLDFEALGYTARRAKVLRELPLARMAQQIRDGEVFQLPKLLEAGDVR